MPIDLNSLPLRSRSQGKNNFVDFLKRAFPGIESTPAWKNRPANDSDYAAQFRYWLGPFVQDPNSQLGLNLRNAIDKRLAGGFDDSYSAATKFFGTKHPEFFKEFAGKWKLPDTGKSVIDRYAGLALAPEGYVDDSNGYLIPATEAVDAATAGMVNMFGNAIEDVADDVGLFKQPGNAEDDWKSYVNALSLVGGVVGAGYGLAGMMGTGTYRKFGVAESMGRTQAEECSCNRS